MVAAIVTSLVTCGLVASCSKHAGTKSPAIAKPALKLAVLAVESDKFPKVAEAATLSLAKARVTGIDRVEVTKVSLEVVQLSIECVEATSDCYEAVGKSLAANRLLFAQVEPGPTAKPLKKLRRGAKKPRDVRVTVTLFDVDTRLSTKTAEKVFSTETEAAAGIDGLIAEATGP
jgi:hypothetical protein